MGLVVTIRRPPTRDVAAAAEPRTPPWLGCRGPGSVQRDELRPGHLRGPHGGSRAVRSVQSCLRDLLSSPLTRRAVWLPIPCWSDSAVWICRHGGALSEAAPGTAAVTGVATGTCVLVVAAGLGGAAKSAFLALGLTLPVLLLQDSWRFSFFALGRGVQAFLNDLVWAVALIPALFFLRATKAQNVFWFVLAWGAGAAVAAGVGLLQARVAPRLSDVTKWLSQHRDLGYRYLVENTTNSGAGTAAHVRPEPHPGPGSCWLHTGSEHAHGACHGPLHGDDHGRDSRGRPDSASFATTPAAVLPLGERWTGRRCGRMGSRASGRATEGSRDLDGGRRSGGQRIRW